MEFTSECRPLAVFKFFELLSSVPHGSGNTKQISDICVDFAKKRGLEYYQDDLNNVIIYKAASKGRENSEPVIIQGHLDMVCAKEPDSDIDMSKEPVKLMIEDGYLKACKTSLGGDDIIAVAIALAVLDDDTLSHPPIEAVFTTDEETGLFGAAGLDASKLKGRRMLNIDSEEEGVFTAGCAGGVRANCSIPVKREKAENCVFFNVTVGGLMGGHSGVDIDKERANSNKMAARFLHGAAKKIPFGLCSLCGGQFDNVITNKTAAVAAVPEKYKSEFESLVSEYDRIFKNELSASDPGVKIECAEIKTDKDPVCAEDTAKILKALFLMPQGVQHMSMHIKGLVQTSLNMGVLALEDDAVKFSFSIRSSIKTQKEALLSKVTELTELFGGTVETHGAYPGWEYAEVSPLRDTVLKAYRDVYGKDGVVSATHGGLECGLFADKIPGIDCISYGPELHDVHSVRERLGIASVERIYKLTCRTLQLLD